MTNIGKKTQQENRMYTTQRLRAIFDEPGGVV